MFVVRAWIGAPLIEALLAFRGMSATLARLERLPLGVGSPDRIGAREGADLVAAAYRWHLVRGACLPRALLQYALHRVDGVDAELHVGVARPSGAPALAAHAWVQSGRPADEALDPSSFATLFRRRTVAA
jgi:hypothetical protein